VEANKKRDLVQADEAVAAEKAAAAKAIKDECEGELAVAMPLLESALAALDTLSKADITEMKSMKSPPSGMRSRPSPLRRSRSPLAHGWVAAHRAGLTPLRAAGVKLVMETVCIIKNIKPKKVNDPNNPAKKIDDYWTPFLAGGAPAPAYCLSLDEDRRAALRERLRATLPCEQDGSIRLSARVWAVRGSA
jgi:dynein heavy chain